MGEGDCPLHVRDRQTERTEKNSKLRPGLSTCGSGRGSVNRPDQCTGQRHQGTHPVERIPEGLMGTSARILDRKCLWRRDQLSERLQEGDEELARKLCSSHSHDFSKQQHKPEGGLF